MSVAAPPSSGPESYGPEQLGSGPSGSADRPRRATAPGPADVDLLFRSIEPVPERVPLPAWGTGNRSSRSRRGPAWFAGSRPARRRHRQQLPRPAPPLLAALAVVVLMGAWVGAGHLFDRPTSSTAGPPTDGAAPAATPAPPVTTLLAVVGPDGTASALTVLVAEPGGGGALVYVPTGTMVEVPSFGLEQVGQSLALGGLELVRAGLENLFGVEVGEAIAVQPTDLAALVADGELTVDVPDTVEARTPEGRVEVVWPKGPVRLSAADAEAFLTVRGDDTELGMLVRHQIFWSAVLSEAAAGAVPAGPLGPTVAALAGGEVEHHTLPVESLGPAAMGEADLYRVDRPATAALVERVMSEAPPVEAVERTRVQLLNGTGEPGLARDVTAALVPAGAEVVVVGNADRFDHPVTQVVFYDRDEQDRAESVRDALGVGEVVFSRHRLDVVDVTVVVGSDFSR